MQLTISNLLRLVLSTGAGWLCGGVFGDRYAPAHGADLGAYWIQDPATHQAACITGACLGLVLGALSLTRWISARSAGVALLRGAAAAGATFVLVNRVGGAFSEKTLPALVAFAVLGALLAALRVRKLGTNRAKLAARRAPGDTLGGVALRGIRGALLGALGGLLLAFVSVGLEPKDLGVLLYAYFPLVFGAVGLVVGLLLPGGRGARPRTT